MGEYAASFSVECYEPSIPLHQGGFERGSALQLKATAFRDHGCMTTVKGEEWAGFFGLDAVHLIITAWCHFW
jgi:hypothetical protein